MFQMPALFVVSVSQTAEHKMAVLRVVFLQLSDTDLNKQDKKSSEKLLCIYIYIIIVMFLLFGSLFS